MYSDDRLKSNQIKVRKFNRARGRVTLIIVDKDGFSNIDSSSGARATGAQMANPAGKLMLTDAAT